MSIFDAFENMDRRSAHFRASAAKAATGLAPEQLVPGAIVTVSSCKATGDRSYTDTIWEVASTNGGHALLRWRAGPKPFSERPTLVQIFEREFYPAEHMLDDAGAQSGEAV